MKSSFSFATFVNITDARGDTHECHCINEDTAKLISSLSGPKLSLEWRLMFHDDPPQIPDDRGPLRALCGTLAVCENVHGFLVSRWFRSKDFGINNTFERETFFLAHQLTDKAIVFPSLEFGKAAAELCFPEPNPQLGFLWWTYPEIH